MANLARTVEDVSIPLAALLVSAILFGAFVAALGADPFAVYHSIYRGAFGSWFSWQNTLQRAAPLMLTALCTALPARLGFIVIGGARWLSVAWRLRSRRSPFAALPLGLPSPR